MAMSGTVSKAITSAIKFVLDWDVVNRDEDARLSEIRVRAYLESTSSATISSSASKAIRITIGSSFTDNANVNISLSARQKKLLYTTSTWVGHKTDGTIANQKIEGYLSLGVTLSGTTYSSVTASGTAAIDPITVGATINAPSSGSRYNFFNLDNGGAIATSIKAPLSGTARLRIYVEDDNSTRFLVKQIDSISGSTNITFTKAELETIISKRKNGNGYLWLVLDTISGASNIIYTQETRVVIEIPNRSTLVLGGEAGPYSTLTSYSLLADNEAFPGQQPWFVEVQFIRNGSVLYTTNKNESGLARGRVNFTLSNTLSGLFDEGQKSSTVELKIYSYWKGPSGTWYLIRSEPIQKSAIINKNGQPPVWTKDITVTEAESTVISVLGSDSTGVFVKSKSRPKITIPAGAASAVSPAVLVSYKIYLNDVLLTTTTSVGITYSHNSQTYINSTSAVIKVEAVDSNGDSSAVYKTLNVVDYKAPNFNGTEIKRQNGYLGNFLTNIRVNFTPLLVNGVQKNTVKNLQVKIKKETEADAAYVLKTNPTVASTDSTGVTYNQANYTGYSQDEAYYVNLTVQDAFNTSQMSTFVVRIGKPLVFFDKVRGSVGFGDFPSNTTSIDSFLRVRAMGGLDVNGTTNITGNTNITGTGTVSGQLHSNYGVSSQYELWSKNGQVWFYDSGKQLKFTSNPNKFEFSDYPIYRGTKKVWDESTLQVQYGSIMTSNEANTPKEISVTFPTAFTSTPTVQLTVAVAAAQNINEATAYNVTTTGFTIYFSRVTAVSSALNEIKWLAIAKN